MPLLWARYSSAQFDQGAGRHACNNPYNVALEDDILENAPKAGKINCIAHNDFLDLIAPSFGGVEDTEDSAAILARTHLIVLTEKGIGAWLAQEKKMFLSLYGLRMSRKTSWLLRRSLSSKLTRRIQRLTQCLATFMKIACGLSSCYARCFQEKMFLGLSPSVVCLCLAVVPLKGTRFHACCHGLKCKPE